jgi:DNA polymerase III epsilon subunit family exonuclease
MSARVVLGLPFFEQQWRAVSAPHGPVLVLAGPGAGKTRCLTGRIGYLLEQGADPHRICAITFTNKAAQEIAHRLRDGLGDGSDALTLGTIHSLCLRLLRDHGRRVGLPANFGVADEEQQRLVLSRLGVHSRRHRPLLTQFGKRRLHGGTLQAGDEKLLAQYNRELRSHHLIDFDEILSLALALLESSASVRDGCCARWDHILVDEFQDLDATQYAVLRILAGGHRSLFAVGDDEQSIFSWRGADPRVMARFLTDFEVGEPIILDVNCRCARPLFEAARRILPAPLPLFAKKITAVRESPYPLRAVCCASEDAEAQWLVADVQEELATSGLKRGEFAILYRNNLTGQRLEEALVAAGVPCLLGKGLALADDPIIGQLLASLRIFTHPESDLHVEQLARQLLPEVVLAGAARQPGATWLERLQSLAEQGSGIDAAACWRFLYQVENLRSLRRLQGKLSDLVHAILEQGIGGFEGPLEERQDLLRDPADLPEACQLAEALQRTLASGSRVLLTPDSGLEIPIKVMLQRALPTLRVEYLGQSTPATNDLVLALHSIDTCPGQSVVLSPAQKTLRIVIIFKALQIIEAARYRKSFAAYVVFDTETTGTDVDRDEVIELAAVRVRQGQPAETFHSLIRNHRSVPPAASAIHGYTDADLRDQPLLEEVWPRFREFVGNDLLVAHNGHRFDVPLLRRLTAECGGVAGLSFLDTLPMARNLFPVAGLKLDDLAARFAIDRRRGHHALDDSLCLVEVFECLQEERVRRARRTCKQELLDCLYLGAALESRAPRGMEEQALVEAGRWDELHHKPAVVDAYVDEAERFHVSCPPLSEVLSRFGGVGGWAGPSRETDVRERYPDSYERLDRLLGLVRATNLEAAVQELLDRAALSASDGIVAHAERVSLVTFHSAKGLEFARVYLAGVEDEVLVGPQASPTEAAEARRLLYVAMTRAKDRLTLTCCRERQGRPSGGTRFIEEMGVAVVSAGAENARADKAVVLR